ncbi:hypothetical protein [Pseudoalteromonas phage C7]|uniref:hypothetical protein n=1 Tax=Pseudoalteromonas phage C7 TaxID=2510494 RepID=UPI00101740B2|nr:hypothetical protein PP587_gp26 [Pseudoalteromonas phage C7]QAY17980.1 hypothetical protein [Pseudoalteromonas phage C7]
MKFNYDLKLPKWLNEKNVTVLSLIVDLILVIAVAMEIYDNSSNMFLMLILSFYLIDDVIDKYYKIKQ